MKNAIPVASVGWIVGPMFGDLSVGDMYNTKAARCVKTRPDEAIVVMSGMLEIGTRQTVRWDMPVIPLFQSDDRRVLVRKEDLIRAIHAESVVHVRDALMPYA